MNFLPLRHAFASLSYISETFLFLYVGMDALDIEKWKFASDSSAKCCLHLKSSLPINSVMFVKTKFCCFQIAALESPLE
jgi:hypothetical protein